VFTIYWVAYVAEVSTLCVIHIDYLALCVTNAVSFVVFFIAQQVIDTSDRTLLVTSSCF